jgi:hypothetical protein
MRSSLVGASIVRPDAHFGGATPPSPQAVGEWGARLSGRRQKKTVS